MHSKMPVYAQLNACLDSDGLLVDAAEIHGLVAGFLSAGMAMDDKAWLPQLAEMINDGQALPEKSHKQVQQLHEATCQQLIDQDFGFAPLLPDDAQDIEERLEALAMWVQGFLAGIGLQQIQLEKASEQLSEAVHDLAEIANVGLEIDASETEANELALTELYEYVRMTVLLTFSEFGKAPQPADQQPLH